MLKRSLAIGEEEKLVLEDRTADVSTFLVSLVRSISGKFGALGAGTEQAVALAVEAVGSGLGDHVDRARRSQFIRKIKAGLCQLEFGNGAGRDALCRCADVFVAHIHAVNFDARRAAKPAAERDRGKSGLGGVEVSAVLNLHAGLELGEVQEVPPVDGQVIDLFRIYDTLNLSLLGVDEHRARGNLNDGGLRAESQSDVA